MSHRIERATLVLASLATLSCASAPRVDIQSEEQRLRELDRQWQAAAAAKDAARFASFYSDDAIMLSAEMPMVKGRAAIEEGIRQMFNVPGLVFTFQQQLLDVAKGGDMAYEVGTASVTTNGVESKGKYLVAWKKINGEWKAVADANSTDAPAPAPPAIVFEIDPGGDAFTTSPASSLGWTDFAPPGFPAGGKIAKMHGDPAQKGDHVYRLKFPAGYTTPFHFHPMSEHITVLSGDFQFGIGERADQTRMVSFGPGDFIYVPAKAPHMAIARTETVLQIHGVGPTTRTLVTK